MAKGKLKIAVCQFSVSRDIRRNTRSICNYIKKAVKAGADILHTPECALSGYAGRDFNDFKDFNWPLLLEQTRTIMALAKKHRIWLALGSVHRLSGKNKPHNSLYLIDPQGRIADRYDKRFCMASEMKHYTPGNHFVFFTINGVKCALLICFDARFGELYRELYKNKVQCVIQSFYNARQKGPSVHTHIMRQTMQCRAASNYLWVSISNASGYYSPYPSCVIRPDGMIVRQLKQNRAGLIIQTIDTGKTFYDPMKGLRESAIRGKLDMQQKPCRDKRSITKTIL